VVKPSLKSSKEGSVDSTNPVIFNSIPSAGALNEAMDEMETLIPEKLRENMLHLAWKYPKVKNS